MCLIKHWIPLVEIKNPKFLSYFPLSFFVQLCRQSHPLEGRKQPLMCRLSAALWVGDRSASSDKYEYNFWYNFSGVNIFLGWIFFRHEYFTRVNIFVNVFVCYLQVHSLILQVGSSYDRLVIFLSVFFNLSWVQHDTMWWGFPDWNSWSYHVKAGVLK